MQLHGKIRFITKVLLAAISLAGITAAYLFITNPSEQDSIGVQVVTVDEPTIDSRKHHPNERRAIEAMADGKPMPDLDEAVVTESLSAKKAIYPAAGIGRKQETKASVRHVDVVKKQSDLSVAKIKNTIDIKTNNKKQIKKTIAKDDPIARLLATL